MQAVHGQGLRGRPQVLVRQTGAGNQVDWPDPGLERGVGGGGHTGGGDKGESNSQGAEQVDEPSLRGHRDDGGD